LWHSLPVHDAEWAAFEAGFLGKGPHCPSTAALFAFVGGTTDERQRLLTHLDGCPACRSWVESFRQGLEAPQAAATPVPGSLLGVFSTRPTAPLPAPAAP